MSRDDYPLYVHWYQTLHWSLNTCERFPKTARFFLANRIVDSTMTILEAIVQAIYQPLQRGAALERINQQLEWLRVLYRIAHERQYLSMRQYEYISRQLDEAGRMAGGWRKAEGQ